MMKEKNISVEELESLLQQIKNQKKNKFIHPYLFKMILCSGILYILFLGSAQSKNAWF